MRRLENCWAGAAPWETDLEFDIRGAWLSEEDVMVSLADGEEIGVSRDRFGGAKNEDSPGLECEMERAHDSALQGRRHVDQNVATAHEVELRERRVLHEILPRENA